MKTRYLALLATLAFLGFSVPAAAHKCSRHADQNHKHCVSDPAPSGGGKAFLFEIDETEFLICGGATDTTGDSFGHVSWSGNVLWDPEVIHVHTKLQLKDVEPGTYPIFGNNDIACPVGQATIPLNFPLCEGGFCDLEIIVKQNHQGRTSGVLHLPGNDPDEPTAVWVTVTVDDGNGGDIILRSTPVTVVLPPNEVGTGQSCPPE